MPCMTSPRPFTLAILPVYGLPSIGERRPQPQAARPAQPGTDFFNVDAGCAASFFMGSLECCINKVGDQLWQLQILAILAMTWLFRFI